MQTTSATAIQGTPCITRVFQGAVLKGCGSEVIITERLELGWCDRTGAMVRL